MRTATQMRAATQVRMVTQTRRLTTLVSRMPFMMAALAVLVLSGAALTAAVAQGDGHGQHGSGSTAAPAATPEQKAAAAQLLASVKASIARYAQVAAAQADGYRQNAPFRFMTWGPAHFGNPANVLDERILDPQRPEGLVYMKLQTGEIVLLGALFKAPKGQGPRPGGPLTEWHSHECVTGDGRALRSMGGQCPPGTRLVERASEMLHVWIFDNPDGPFAHGLTNQAIQAAVRQVSHTR